MERKASGKMEWSSKEGKSIRVEVEVTLYASSKKLWADGYEIETKQTEIAERVIHTAYYEDVKVGYAYNECGKFPKGVVASIGQIGLYADKKLELEKLVEKLKSEAKKDFSEYEKGEKEESEKEALAKKNAEELEKMYNENIASGMCKKCGTWCYGDCEVR